MMKSSVRGSFRRLLLGSIFLPLASAGVQAQQPQPPENAQAGAIEIFFAEQDVPVNAQGKENASPQNAKPSGQQNAAQNGQPNAKAQKQVVGQNARVGAVVDLDLDGRLDFQAASQAGATAVYYVHNPVENLLGANMAPPDGAVRAHLGIPADRGLVITSIVNEGPAAKVGLAANDILLMVADKPVANVGDIGEALKGSSEKVVGLKLLRAGKEVALNVRSVPRVTWAPATDKVTGFFIGVSAAPIEETLQVHLGLPKNQGLIAKEIIAESPAEKCGIKAHDVLIELNGVSLDQADTLQKAVQESHGQPVKFKLIRAGKPLNIQVTPEARAREADAATAATWVLVDRDPSKIWQNTGNGTWGEVAAGNVAVNSRAFVVENPNEVFKSVRMLPLVETVYDPRIAAAYHGSINTQADPAQALTARIDRLESEIKAIKAAVESIRDALKK